MGRHHRLHDTGGADQVGRLVDPHTYCDEHAGVGWDGHYDEDLDEGSGDGYAMDGDGYGGKHGGDDVGLLSSQTV